MSRPAHIAPLDEALEDHLTRLKDAEVRQVEVVARHADAIREVEAAAKERQDAFYAAQSCENAIRKLGYVVLDGNRTVAPDKSRLDGHGGNFRKPHPTPPPADDTASAGDGSAE